MMACLTFRLSTSTALSVLHIYFLSMVTTLSHVPSHFTTLLTPLLRFTSTSMLTIMHLKSPHEVMFAYPLAFPSRLDIVTIYFPAFETAFIIGDSQIHHYLAPSHIVRTRRHKLDVQYLDTYWTPQQIRAISWGAILFNMTIHDNIAMGSQDQAANGDRMRCTGRLLRLVRHDSCIAFIDDLPV